MSTGVFVGWRGYEAWVRCDDCQTLRPPEQTIEGSRTCPDCKQSVLTVQVCADKEICGRLLEALPD